MYFLHLVLTFNPHYIIMDKGVLYCLPAQSVPPSSFITDILFIAGASGDEVSQPQRPSMATSNYSAVWPGVIFPSSHTSRRLTRDDGTQV